MSYLHKAFNVQAFPIFRGLNRTVVRFHRKQMIFSQGERSDAVFYIETGIVKLTVTSHQGKEAIVGLFGKGQLFGENCLASDNPVRFHNAIALTNLLAVKVDRNTMIPLVCAGGKTSHTFITYLLERSAGVHEDLVDNLLMSSDERLTQVLHFLAEFDQEGNRASVPRLSQQTLAEMLGITRQRVNALMKRFRKLELVKSRSVSQTDTALPTIDVGDRRRLNQGTGRPGTRQE
jgi:CRP/FNR family cyclic AMP-dependent transcriptional regulator